jgi:hypothetical protein
VLPPEALDRIADANISAGVMERHPGYSACIDADLVRKALDLSRSAGPSVDDRLVSTDARAAGRHGFPQSDYEVS